MRESRGTRRRCGRGAVDAHARCCEHEAGDRRRASPIRWSPCGVDAAARAAATARRGSPSRRRSRARAPPIARSSSATVARRFGLLDAQLARAAHDRACRAPCVAGERQQRQLVDQRSARSRARSRVATSSAGRTSTSAIGSPPAGRAPVEEVDARAHPLQHRQQARARRVDADMPRTNRRDSASSVAATRNGAAEEMSPGHLDALAAARRSTGQHRDACAAAGDARAGGAQQALGVVARRHRLDHDRRAVARRTGRRAGRTT